MSLHVYNMDSTFLSGSIPSANLLMQGRSGDYTSYVPVSYPANYQQDQEEYTGETGCSLVIKLYPVLIKFYFSFISSVRQALFLLIIQCSVFSKVYFSLQ